MSLKQVTLIAMIGCSVALAFSLASYGEAILHQRIWPKLWFILAAMVVKEGSIIFFSATCTEGVRPRYELRVRKLFAVDCGNASFVFT